MKTISIYLIALLIGFTYSCKQEVKKDADKASALSTSTTSEVKLTKQMPDSEQVFLIGLKTQTPYKTGGFEPAATTMNTRFGKLEFPGGYPTEETIQKVYDELDLQKATQLYLKHVSCAFDERND